MEVRLAAVAKAERLNAEAMGALLKRPDVEAAVAHGGAQLRTGIDAARREIDAQLPDDCREAILATFDDAFEVTLAAVSKAWEGI